jgi:hypothetical protein
MAQTQIQLSFPEMDDRNWDEVEPPPATSTDAPPDKFSPKVANEA